MNRRYEPLDPEERALARLLADTGDDGPSPEVDARILTAAREPLPAVPPEVATAPPAAYGAQDIHGARRPRRRRLPLALGLAASVTLAVGVAWQLREPPQPAFAPAGAAVDAESVRKPAAVVSAPQAEVDASADAAGPPLPDVAAAAPAQAPAAGKPVPVPHITPPARSESAPAAAPRQASAVEAPQPPAAQPAPSGERERQAADMATRRAMQRTEAAAGQAAKAAAPAAVREPAEPRPVDVYAPPPPPPPPAPTTATAAPQAPPVQEMEVDLDSLDGGRAAAVAAFADLAAAPDKNTDAATAIEDDANLPVAQWLQRIRDRQARGERALARASLARLVETHPAVSIPEDLQPLLP